MAQSWALFVLSLHFCTAQRTCTQILHNARTELRPTLKIRLRHTLDTCYAAVLGLCRLQILCGQAGLWVADTQKSYTSLWGQLLTRETSNRLPFPLQSLPPELLSQAIHVYVLSWASQVLHWKKVTITPFSVYEERLSGFLPMKPETHFGSWKLLQNQQPSHDLIFKGTDLIPRRQ